MGPVPNWNRKTAEMMVVRLESKMAVKAREKPWDTALRTPLPTASSSFILSKMRTLASTAMPMARMMPAMPGRVRAALK
jgi:hypothetical protein